MKHSTVAPHEFRVLRDSLTKVSDELNGIGRDLLELAKSEASEVSDKIQDEMQGGVRTLRSAVEKGVESGQKLATEAKRQVEEHPTVTLLTSFGLGLLVGKLFLQKE